VVPAADPNDFPRALAEVTTEWLSSVVGKEVTAFDSTPLEMGVLSDLGIVALTYADGPAAGPPSVVCKFAKGIDESRGSAVGTDAYIKEIQFFSSLGKEVPFRSPECLALFRDKDKPNEYFCIVMENSAPPPSACALPCLLMPVLLPVWSVEPKLRTYSAAAAPAATAPAAVNDAGYAVMDQVSGLSIDQMKALNTPVAKLHGDFWGKELLDADWLNPGRANNTVRVWFDLWMDGFRLDPKGLCDRYIASLKQKEINEPGSVTESVEALDNESFRKLVAIVSKQQAICHCHSSSSN
jgi:hypothetical protein